MSPFPLQGGSRPCHFAWELIVFYFLYLLVFHYFDPVARGFEDWCGFRWGEGKKNLANGKKSRIFPT